MRTAVFVLFVACLVCTSTGAPQEGAQETAGQAAAGGCPRVCNQLWAPVCARNGVGTKLTFASECAMHARNCQDGSDYAKESSGVCGE